jgi:hypothetical protein
VSTKKTRVVDHWIPIATSSNPTGVGWLSYPENKPEERLLCCMVCNVRGYMRDVLAIYDREADVFTQYDPRAPQRYVLAVTHYWPIPEPPKETE